VQFGRYDWKEFVLNDRPGRVPLPLNRRRFLASSVASAFSSRLNAFENLGTDLIADPVKPLSFGETPPAFISARPVWPVGKDTEMNLFAGFRAKIEPADGPVFLRIAASTLYRTYVNGQFHAWGPARGPHGYFRVDLFEITPFLQSGANLVCIEVAGYNINSFYVLNQPSFLQAEITSGETVLAATGDRAGSFESLLLPERIQKVQRYSFQRAFSEAYRLDPTSSLWRKDADAPIKKTACAVSSPRRLIARVVPYPAFDKRQPEHIALGGGLETFTIANPYKDRSLTDIGPLLRGFPETELELTPSIELQGIRNVNTQRLSLDYSASDPVSLKVNEFSIVDFGTDLTGFVGAKIKTKTNTKLYFTFDEMLTDDDVDFKRLSCVNILTYILQPGVYDLESLEPYTLRYLKLMVLEGECEAHDIYLRECAAPNVWTAHFESNDEGLNTLFAAGRETYRQNAVDLFTDCPSRERAGWLCDSYFTAETALMLSGDTKIETAFLQNFQLPVTFPHLPPGMLPMCYPSDHDDGGFIPNWALWFVLQVEQYLKRSGNRELVEALRLRVLALFDYFGPFRNDSGLLEKLPGWVFIEWSKANDYVQDVNYPTNMLYAAALASAGRIYGVQVLIRQADAIKKTIQEQSFDGEFFVDNAVRNNGELKRTVNRTETCQYYAFYLGTATSESHPDLWMRLLNDFGPQRKESNKFPDVAPSNAFIGNILRLELLSNAGLTEQLLHESRAYLLYMADRTGTLWEDMSSAHSSLDHGFASHIVKALYRDILGVYEIDMIRKVVTLRFTDNSVERCAGDIPVPGGFVSLKWEKENQVLNYRIDVPAGYSVTVRDLSKTTLCEIGTCLRPPVSP
jgi:alpha-L-rhamnosidase